MSSRLDAISARLRRRRSPSAADAAEVRVHEDDLGEVFELVEAARAGERTAFAVLYDRFHLRVYRAALARLGSVEDAEDVVSETFLRAWRALDRFEWTGAPFASWLLAIGASRVKDAQRAGARRPSTAMAEVPEQDVRGAAPADQEQAEQRIEVAALLEQLPERQRTVLVLRFYGGLSAEEIGQQLGASADSVRQLQLRALERLARLQRKEHAA